MASCTVDTGALVAPGDAVDSSSTWCTADSWTSCGLNYKTRSRTIKARTSVTPPEGLNKPLSARSVIAFLATASTYRPLTGSRKTTQLVSNARKTRINHFNRSTGWSRQAARMTQGHRTVSFPVCAGLSLWYAVSLHHSRCAHIP